MESTIKQILSDLSDKHTHVSYSRLESLVYIVFSEKNKDTSMFDRDRFGVNSEKFDYAVGELVEKTVLRKKFAPHLAGRPGIIIGLVNPYPLTK